MHIQLETRNTNSITAYDESQLMINGVTYQDSLVVSKDTIISPWFIRSLKTMTEADLSPIVELQPEVLLFGSKSLSDKLPFALQQWLSQQRIGIECMQIGAACRTFNVLLSENRNVVLGIAL